MSDLPEFLLARIAEDEHDAYHAQGALLGVVTEWHEVEGLRDRGLTRSDARHAHRWSPARVLAECEAKRRIVEQEIRRDVGPVSHYISADVHEAIRARLATPNLRALALPYAEHPDYREEWRP